jgi:hypothetical protein
LFRLIETGLLHLARISHGKSSKSRHFMA